MSGQTSNQFYITTPIFYPNGAPHIGHGYTAIVTDAIARFERLDGKDVFHLTGTDEHGLKMKQTAIKDGITPLQLADKNSAQFRDLMTALGTAHDDFIRTTELRHYEACQELWRRMEASGDIYLNKYGGWYSVRQEAYFGEEETTVGEDGVRREPLGSPVEWTEEESYFFRLSKYQDKLLAHYAAHPEFILPPERRNEVVSFVSGGLQDLSISRGTLDWGVPVPLNPSHVMYVWTDALTNYVTATGVLNKGEQSAQKILAGAGAYHRQGHHALSRGVLAGVPDERGRRVAGARVRTRVPQQPRGEDVEVGGQRDRPV